VSAPEEGPQGPAVLGHYGPLTITARASGGVALDFTGKGQPGPFVTLNAMQWRYLYAAVASAKRPH
jgi:hypothetical protein